MTLHPQPEDQHPRNQVVVLRGHSNWVRTVAFSPNGRHLASGSDDNTLILWDIESEAQVSKLEGHSNWVTSVTFSPDGQYLASASTDHSVRLWSASTGVHIATINGHSSWVQAIVFSPDSSRLASASFDRTIRLWEVTSGNNSVTMTGHSEPAFCVAFSPDGACLASGSSDGTIRLWEIGAATTHSATLAGHSRTVSSVAFSADGAILASGSYDKTIRLWDAGSRVCIITLEGHSSIVNSVAISPDGLLLASGSYDKSIRLWDIPSRTHIATLNGHSSTVNAVAFSPDGASLAFGSGDRTVRLLKVGTKTETAPLEDNLKWVYSTTFTPNSSTFTSHAPEKTIQLLHPIGGASPIPSFLDMQHFDSTILSSQGAMYMTTSSSSSSSSADASLSTDNDISTFVSLMSGDRISSGGFGDLFLGYHKDLGKVALKRPHILLNETSVRRFLREVGLWCKISHRYILPCLGTCKIGKEVYMVSPFIENGDLPSCMERGMTLNCGKLLYEVAEALSHLHHRGIIHGDIKAQNILLSDEGSAIVCDFGLAKAFDTMVTSTDARGTGSVRWMAPELFLGESRSMASDVYSFGMTIAEVLSGRPPYDHMTENLAVMLYVIQKNGRPPKEPLSSSDGKSYSLLWETAEKCWTQEAKQRPYMAEVLGMLFPQSRGVSPSDAARSFSPIMDRGSA